MKGHTMNPSQNPASTSSRSSAYARDTFRLAGKQTGRGRTKSHKGIQQLLLIHLWRQPRHIDRVLCFTAASSASSC